MPIDPALTAAVAAVPTIEANTREDGAGTEHDVLHQLELDALAALLGFADAAETSIGDLDGRVSALESTGGGVAVQGQGVGLGAGPAGTLNFVGDGVSAERVGDRVDITIPGGGGAGGQAALQFSDEGVALGSAGTVESVNFAGGGVAVTRTGNSITVNVPGSGGFAGHDARIMLIAPSGYWRLNETSGTSAIDVVAANNGVYTNTGNITLNQSGMILGSNDGCPLFGGSNGHVNIGQPSIFNLSSADEFSAFCVVSVVSPTTANIFAKANSTNRLFQIAISSGNLFVQVGTTSSTFGTVAEQNAGKSSSIGIVHRIFSGTRYTDVYVNGRFIGQIVGGSFNDGAGVDAIIGARRDTGNSGLSGPFHGKVQRVAFWRRALSPPEMAYISNLSEIG